jgi:hypothetical protein
MAMVCCLAWRSQPTIFISASSSRAFLVGYRKVYSGRREADVVMSSVILARRCRDHAVSTQPEMIPADAQNQ